MPLFDSINASQGVASVDETKGEIVFPPPDSSWMSPRRVNYIKDFIEMLFYALAFPWLMFHFFRNPFQTIRIVGEARAG